MPDKPSTKRCGKSWWIVGVLVDDPPPPDSEFPGIPQDWLGPYGTQVEADEDLRGLVRFYNTEVNRRVSK